MADIWGDIDDVHRGFSGLIFIEKRRAQDLNTFLF